MCKNRSNIRHEKAQKQARIGQKLGEGSSIIGCFTKAEFLQPNMSQLPGHKLDKSYTSSVSNTTLEVTKLTNQHKT